MQTETTLMNGSGSTRERRIITEYYGKVLERSADLRTNACCSVEAMSPYLLEIMRSIAPEVIEKFYGCGSPIPPSLEGRTVLDLGCGSGRDVFACSALVGDTGLVIGIDMTPEQLDVARRHATRQAATFGLAAPNTSFCQGYIEDLAAAGIEDDSVDVVVSNCVINLSPSKERVFREILRVLKPGGELLFSDVYADRRLDPGLWNDPVLVGECLAGAMYWEDFRRLMARLGVPDVRVVSSSPISISSPGLEERLGAARFTSVTVRAYKLTSLEDRCEDYGQIAVYRGGIKGAPHRFRLDDHHEFETGRPMRVCGNTASMLGETRLAAHFLVTGDRRHHFGLFPCTAQDAPPSAEGSGSCC